MQKVKSFWNERWVKVAPENGDEINNEYFLSDYGRVKRFIPDLGEELLNVRIDQGGFRRVIISVVNSEKRKAFTFPIHKKIAEYFVKKKNPDAKFVLHIDDNKDNNHYKNLKWVTRDELTVRWRERGVFNFRNGNNFSATKMTESRVRLLKKKIKEGKTKKKILARQFNISYMQLNRIERGENWGHVKLDNKDL